MFWLRNEDECIKNPENTENFCMSAFEKYLQSKL